MSKYTADIFYGYVAPPKTPTDAIKSLSDMFVKAMNAPETKSRLDQQGLIPVNMCGTAFSDYLTGMVTDYRRIIQEAGIKAGN